MPTISQALEQSNSDDYQLICSSNGLKIISENNENKKDGKDKITISHCNYCSFVVDEEVVLSKKINGENLLRFEYVNLTHSSLLIIDHFFLAVNPAQAPPSI